MGEANVPFQIFSTPRADGRIYGLNDGGIVKSYSRIYDLGGKSGKTNGFQSVSVSPFKRSVHRSRFFFVFMWQNVCDPKRGFPISSASTWWVNQLVVGPPLPGPGRSQTRWPTAQVAGWSDAWWQWPETFMSHMIFLKSWLNILNFKILIFINFLHSIEWWQVKTGWWPRAQHFCRLRTRPCIFCAPAMSVLLPYRWLAALREVASRAVAWGWSIALRFARFSLRLAHAACIYICIYIYTVYIYIYIYNICMRSLSLVAAGHLHKNVLYDHYMSYIHLHTHTRVIYTYYINTHCGAHVYFSWQITLSSGWWTTPGTLRITSSLRPARRFGPRRLSHLMGLRRVVGRTECFFGRDIQISSNINMSICHCVYIYIYIWIYTYYIYIHMNMIYDIWYMIYVYKIYIYIYIGARLWFRGASRNLQSCHVVYRWGGVTSSRLRKMKDVVTLRMLLRCCCTQ